MVTNPVLNPNISLFSVVIWLAKVFLFFLLFTFLSSFSISFLMVSFYNPSFSIYLISSSFCSLWLFTYYYNSLFFCYSLYSLSPKTYSSSSYFYYYYSYSYFYPSYSSLTTSFYSWYFSSSLYEPQLAFPAPPFFIAFPSFLSSWLCLSRILGLSKVSLGLTSLSSLDLLVLVSFC